MEARMTNDEWEGAGVRVSVSKHPKLFLHES